MSMICKEIYLQALIGSFCDALVFENRCNDRRDLKIYFALRSVNHFPGIFQISNKAVNSANCHVTAGNPGARDQARSGLDPGPPRPPVTPAPQSLGKTGGNQANSNDKCQNVSCHFIWTNDALDC